MSDAEIRELLAKRNTVITGDHFVYTMPKGEGDHGDAYVNKDAIYTNPLDVSLLCNQMALGLGQVMQDFNVAAVVGPEKGGLILSTWLTYHLNCMYPTSSERPLPIASVYAEKAEKGGFVLRRGYNKLVAVSGGYTIVVEDILNSGGTAGETVSAVKAAGGQVIAVVAICNRGGVTAEQLDIPVLHSLVSFDFKKYPEAECPYCAQNISVRTDLGHGAEFLNRQQAKQNQGRPENSIS